MTMVSIKSMHVTCSTLLQDLVRNHVHFGARRETWIEVLSDVITHLLLSKRGHDAMSQRAVMIDVFVTAAR